ncbi:asparagine synthase-related protein [Micromonospora sp. NPDC020750]|uniref:asparagine synthase-related protein n=1 Tax=unclassified Micromonospora TaxID=2617518 RepID=UPI00379941BF
MSYRSSTSGTPYPTGRTIRLGRRTERMGMVVGIEVRVPFCDHALEVRAAFARASRKSTFVHS